MACFPPGPSAIISVSTGHSPSSFLSVLISSEAGLSLAPLVICGVPRAGQGQALLQHVLADELLWLQLRNEIFQAFHNCQHPGNATQGVIGVTGESATVRVANYYYFLSNCNLQRVRTGKEAQKSTPSKRGLIRSLPIARASSATEQHVNKSNFPPTQLVMGLITAATMCACVCFFH